MVANNKNKKGKFEKLFLEGRPPVALGVTSGGDVFGGTQVVFTDVLGDQQISMFVGVGLAVPNDVVQLAESGEAPSSGRCKAIRKRSSITVSSKTSSTIRPFRA